MRFEALARQNIEERLASLTDEVANGHCVDHAAYKERCGKIAGLRLALDALDDSRSELEKER